MSNNTSVGIVYKYRHKPAQDEAMRIAEWLRDREVNVHMEEMTTSAESHACPKASEEIRTAACR